MTKPLTRAELQNRVLEGVKRRETEATKETNFNDFEKIKEKAAQKQKQKK